MKSFLILFSRLFILNSTFAQTNSDSAAYVTALKQQADTMAQLLLKKDYSSFVKYTYPAIITMAGGKDKLLSGLKTAMKNMEAQGYTITKVEIGEPSAMVKKDKEWQCTVPEILELKTKDGRLVTKSTLIAVSKDNGKNWYFIDTQGKNISTLKEQLPNLSSALVIPAKEQPTFYKD